MDDFAQDEWLATLSAAAVLYAAMLGATVAGQLGGIGINAVAGSHRLWIPLLCSVVLEALAGARAGAARKGGALGPEEAARISVTYSLGLVLLSVPLVVWIVASRPAASAPLDFTFVHGLVALAALVIGTGLRWLLMLAFAPSRP